MGWTELTRHQPNMLRHAGTSTSTSTWLPDILHDSTSSESNKRRLCDRDRHDAKNPKKIARKETNRSGQARRRQALHDKIDELAHVLGSATRLYKGKEDRVSVLQTSAKLLWAQYCPPKEFFPDWSALPVSPFPDDRTRLNNKWKEAEVGLYIPCTSMQSLDRNCALLKQLGYTPFEVRSAWDLMSPETATYALKEFGTLITGQKEKVYTQGQIRHKDGQYRWWHGCTCKVALNGTSFLFGWMQVTANVSQEDSPLSRPFVHCLEAEAAALTHVRMQFQ